MPNIRALYDIDYKNQTYPFIEKNGLVDNDVYAKEASWPSGGYGQGQKPVCLRKRVSTTNYYGMINLFSNYYDAVYYSHAYEETVTESDDLYKWFVDASDLDYQSFQYFLVDLVGSGDGYYEYTPHEIYDIAIGWNDGLGSSYKTTGLIPSSEIYFNIKTFTGTTYISGVAGQGVLDAYYYKYHMYGYSGESGEYGPADGFKIRITPAVTRFRFSTNIGSSQVKVVPYHSISGLTYCKVPIVPTFTSS